MKTQTLKLMCTLLIVAAVFVFPTTSKAALIVANILDDNGEWTVINTLGGSITGWITGTNGGITPTAGTDTLAFNSGFSNQSGTAFIVFTDLLSQGLYTVSLDVGNYDLVPFSILGAIGMSTGGSQPTTPGSILAPTSSSTPTPALGTIETFTYTYDITAGHSNLGDQIGFVITVPLSGGSANVAFDNLQIDFAPVPEPSTVILLGIGCVALLGHRWRKRRVA